MSRMTAPAHSMPTRVTHTVRGRASLCERAVTGATRIQAFGASHPKAPISSGVTAATKCAPAQTITMHDNDVVACRDETEMSRGT